MSVLLEQYLVVRLGAHVRLRTWLEGLPCLSAIRLAQSEGWRTCVTVRQTLLSEALFSHRVQRSNVVRLVTVRTALPQLVEHQTLNL